jgi:hypothetical protein
MQTKDAHRWTSEPSPSTSLRPRPIFRASATAANKGETIVIARAGAPVAKLVPIGEPKRGKFKFDLIKVRSRFVRTSTISLPDDIPDAFEGKSD